MSSQATAQMGPSAASTQKAVVQPWLAISTMRTGAEMATPRAAPIGSIDVGIERLDSGIRACREVRAVLTYTRAAGLTRPGSVAAGLGDDFVIGVADIPVKPEPAEPNRDLPPEIMQQLGAARTRLVVTARRTLDAVRRCFG
jgi:hypothetical protein